LLLLQDHVVRENSWQANLSSCSHCAKQTYQKKKGKTKGLHFITKLPKEEKEKH
jgi:hypothetical protein